MGWGGDLCEEKVIKNLLKIKSFVFKMLKNIQIRVNIVQKQSKLGRRSNMNMFDLVIIYRD